MNDSLARTRRYLLLAAFILLLTATACVSRRSGVSWADMTVVGEENLILVSYNDFMALVNPANGNQITLGMVNDELRNNSTEAAQNWEIAGEDIKAQFFERRCTVQRFIKSFCR